MIIGWFDETDGNYNEFVSAMLAGDIEVMNIYMNRVSRDIFSYFDTGNRPADSEWERFYYGFVLGLIAELYGRYTITSNCESGYGRYDVMLKPKKEQEDAIIIEFKVYNERREYSLEDTVAAALK